LIGGTAITAPEPLEEQPIEAVPAETELQTAGIFRQVSAQVQTGGVIQFTFLSD